MASGDKHQQKGVAFCNQAVSENRLQEADKKHLTESRPKPLRPGLKGWGGRKKKQRGARSINNHKTQKKKKNNPASFLTILRRKESRLGRRARLRNEISRENLEKQRWTGGT